jgi:hypothetical protein
VIVVRRVHRRCALPDGDRVRRSDEFDGVDRRVRGGVDHVEQTVVVLVVVGVPGQPGVEASALRVGRQAGDREAVESVDQIDRFAPFAYHQDPAPVCRIARRVHDRPVRGLDVLRTARARDDADAVIRDVDH